MVLKLNDPDDKIRASVVQLITDLKVPFCQSLSEEVLKNLMSRIRDKKPAVRERAIVGLGRLFNEALDEM